MNLFVGVTDNDWFHTLAEAQPDEVNFWRPSGVGFGALQQWEPFLFKLHSPYDFIVGGGFFVHFTRLPLSMAWEVFGQKNGAADYLTFRERVMQYRPGGGHPDPVIGCIVLTQPFFLDARDWLPVPDDFAANIVVGKTYDTEKGTGAQLWSQVQMLLASRASETGEAVQLPMVLETPGYGEGYMVKPRLGQGGFRTLVTEAYHRRCSMTGERTLPVLQASHIKPYAQSGPHRVDNGLLLRADLHILFDRGYLTVTKDHHVEVSPRIKEEFENGHDYYAMHGQRLQVLPDSEEERPAVSFIEWHNNEVYVP